MPNQNANVEATWVSRKGKVKRIKDIKTGNLFAIRQSLCDAGLEEVGVVKVIEDELESRGEQF